jgi:hypothetical protein
MRIGSYERAASLFKEALELAPIGRGEFINQAARGDEELAMQVLRMIAYVEKADTKCVLNDDPASQQSPPVDVALIGAQIGPFRIVSVIGEGGFGVVFRAEQDQPVSRSVAIKVLRAPNTMIAQRVASR